MNVGRAHKRFADCPYAQIDDNGLVNCLRGDSHVGFCRIPCPYGRGEKSDAAAH
ncbi:MAG: hypothetical protein QXZ68_06585 [Candidatus Bathyarchaeia archaeon]